MVSLPPKRNLTPTKSSKQHLTPLQVLLQMGFPKHRAEKALAATGHAGAQISCNWLLAHVNDPFLDDTSAREYILYACPTGPFLQELQTFWKKSFALCGWNGAHNFTPHITLVSFFKAPDEDSLNLAQSLQTVIEKQGAVLDEPLKLETYTSPNFMGFFVAEEHADYLKRMAMQYVKEVSTAIINDTYEQFDALTACFPWCTTTTARCIPRGSRSISLEPHVKSLHLTLAYQFPSSQYSNLKSLIDELDLNAPCSWELRLYSKDPRINGKQVYKVVHTHYPIESDELELKTGDFIYVNGEALATSADGWVEGTSWLTGQNGLVPISYIERTSESDAWTLHKRVSLNNITSPEDPLLDNRVSSVDDKMSAAEGDLENAYFTEQAGGMQLEEVSEKNDTRQIFIVRHGERIDFTFGTWVPYCFDENDSYFRKDLNMPVRLPTRQHGSNAYLKDSPLTNLGIYQAKLIGEALLENNVRIDYAYSSPSYRCIQTCDSLLEGMKSRDKVKIKVEPGLFEFMGWYPPGSVPYWMTTEELLTAGYNVDESYQPFVDEKEVKESSENCDQFYLRNAFITRSVLSTTPKGNVLFVGHTATLDSCSHELLGRKPRPIEDMLQIIQKVPYCSLVQLTGVANEWKMSKPPCLPLTHSSNAQFNWKILLQ